MRDDGVAMSLNGSVFSRCCQFAHGISITKG